MVAMSELLTLIDESPDLQAFPAHGGKAATVFEAGAADVLDPCAIIDVEDGAVRLNWRNVLASTNGKAKSLGRRAANRRTT